MKTAKAFRNGAVGALMDEYERAAAELKNLLHEISQEEFIEIVDTNTEDPACRSIQTIMNHVVRAGYGYANYIRKHYGDQWTEKKEDYEINNAETGVSQLDNMLKYTIDTLANKWELKDDDMDKCQIKTSWGQEYDFEQLFEHAIVHILRHRRQIERFLIKQRTQTVH
jgi:uncharacterized damage-inducible protein DinB